MFWKYHPLWEWPVRPRAACQWIIGTIFQLSDVCDDTYQYFHFVVLRLNEWTLLSSLVKDLNCQISSSWLPVLICKFVTLQMRLVLCISVLIHDGIYILNLRRTMQFCSWTCWINMCMLNLMQFCSWTGGIIVWLKRGPWRAEGDRTGHRWSGNFVVMFISELSWLACSLFFLNLLNHCIFCLFYMHLREDCEGWTLRSFLAFCLICMLLGVFVVLSSWLTMW